MVITSTSSENILDQRARKGRKGMVLIEREDLDGGPWPCEIQPGHRVMLRLKLGEIVKAAEGRKVGRAFVSSAVGDRFTASRRDMKTFRKRLREVAPELAK